MPRGLWRLSSRGVLYLRLLCEEQTAESTAWTPGRQQGGTGEDGEKQGPRIAVGVRTARISWRVATRGVREKGLGPGWVVVRFMEEKGFGRARRGGTKVLFGHGE